MSDLTRILDRVEQGDRKAGDELLVLVYDELRRVAAHKMAGEAACQTLQPTALVHEAWLRLVRNQDQRWQNRGHFFAAAAEAMRRILIDRARKRQVRQASGLTTPEQIHESRIQSRVPEAELMALHEVLDRFADVDPEAARLVKLRYFVGMNLTEAAEALGVSHRAAERLWTFARAWLRDAILRDRSAR